jgi:hypothetical protein
VCCAACHNGLGCHLTAHDGQVLDHSMLHKYIFFHVSIYNSILEWTTITGILSPF